MKISVGRLIPRAAVLGIVGYCVWPTVSDFMYPAPAAPPAKVPEMAADLLSPAMPPALTRDPFAPVMTAQAEKGVAKPRGAKSVSNAQTANRDNPAEPAQPDRQQLLANVLAGLSLEATMIAGNRRLAVINGRSYALDDTLAAANRSAPTVKILEVLPYKVLLESGGKTFELTYSDAGSRAATPAHAGAQPPTSDAKPANDAKKN